MTTIRKKVLGRGLDALLASHEAEYLAPTVLDSPGAPPMIRGF